MKTKTMKIKEIYDLINYYIQEQNILANAITRRVEEGRDVEIFLRDYNHVRERISYFLHLEVEVESNDDEDEEYE